MAKIRFVEHTGEEHEVEAQTGGSVMLAAITNGVPGIDADCGGACSCATCHVYIAKEYAVLTGAPDEMEQAMLEDVDDVRDTSRLSCQIKVSEQMDGLTVVTPESQ